MLLSGRIDAMLSEASKTVKLSKKQLLSLAAFLKITDINGKITFHNLKNQHDEVFKKLDISMSTASKCLSS